jgi:hypothetical protein
MGGTGGGGAIVVLGVDWLWVEEWRVLVDAMTRPWIWNAVMYVLIPGSLLPFFEK